MTKAEEQALKAYPIKMAVREGYDENLRERKGFVKGYKQAIKDMQESFNKMQASADSAIDAVKALNSIVCNPRIKDKLVE